MPRASGYVACENDRVWASVTVVLGWTCFCAVGLWSATDLDDRVSLVNDPASCLCPCPFPVSGRVACLSKSPSSCLQTDPVSGRVTCLAAGLSIDPAFRVWSYRASFLWTQLAASCMVRVTARACRLRLALRSHSWPRFLSTQSAVSSPLIYSLIDDLTLPKPPSELVPIRSSRPSLGYRSCCCCPAAAKLPPSFAVSAAVERYTATSLSPCWGRVVRKTGGVGRTMTFHHFFLWQSARNAG